MSETNIFFSMDETGLEPTGQTIIIFTEETFSRSCGFRKGPLRLRLKTNISKRTKNMKFIKKT